MVLNQALFEALRKLNKGNAPKIVNAGQTGRFRVEMIAGKPTLHGEGEQYSINCPFCGDTRQRLYVHHMFGRIHHVHGFNQPGQQLVTLAYCHNETKRIKLIGYVEGYLKVDATAQTMDFLNQRNSAGANLQHSCPGMGETTPLQDLHRGHPAVEYLIGRGFDPGYLGRTCGAVLMVKHPDPYIGKISDGRIGFGHHIDGKLKLWHARLAYDAGKKKWPPKWWFPSGTIKVPWNVDVASHFPVVVLCEGILSAVNAGPAAIAIGGKTITQETLGIISTRWKRAFVMLDPDAGINRPMPEPGKIRMLDYQIRLVDQLTAAGMQVTAAKWALGDLRDPGDLGLAGSMQVIKNSDALVAATLDYK